MQLNMRFQTKQVGNPILDDFNKDLWWNQDLINTTEVEQKPPVLKPLHWFPVSHRTGFKILLLACKGLNGLGPKSVSKAPQVIWDGSKVPWVRTRRGEAALSFSLFSLTCPVSDWWLINKLALWSQLDSGNLEILNCLEKHQVQFPCLNCETMLDVTGSLSTESASIYLRTLAEKFYQTFEQMQMSLTGWFWICGICCNNCHL